MRTITISCDLCKVIPAKEYTYIVDREMDPSGNGYNDVYKYTDLCDDCIKYFREKNKNAELIELIRHPIRE